MAKRALRVIATPVKSQLVLATSDDGRMPGHSLKESRADMKSFAAFFFV
jgi:hypothetical protein